jgi:hypothetical protein
VLVNQNLFRHRQSEPILVLLTSVDTLIFDYSVSIFDLPKAGNRVTIAGQGVVSWTAHL